MSAQLLSNSGLLLSGAMPAISSGPMHIEPATFLTNLERRPFVVRHQLADHRLFQLSRLVELAGTLPAKSVEYNAGNIPINMDPTKTPHTGLSAEETIRRIEVCRSWLVLKNVEQNEEYAALLDACIDQIMRQGHSASEGMCHKEAFVFISSPGSVTPYHMDPECNFLLQIRGQKQMSVWNASDRDVLSEQELERFYSGAHRNMVFKDEYQAKAELFTLNPGDALHVPVTAPHWVKNLDAVSISFSITFMTRAMERRGIIYGVNHQLRAKGCNPRPVGQSAWRDSVKYNWHRLKRRFKRLWRSHPRNNTGNIASSPR